MFLLAHLRQPGKRGKKDTRGLWKEGSDVIYILSLPKAHIIMEETI
jgi:hypothetical protein